MGRRIQPLSIYLFISDMILVPLSMYLAAELRTIVPLGRGGALPEQAAAVPWYVLLISVVCWAIGLLASGSYDPQRSLRWFMEALRVVWGGTLATILMAGFLYIAFRELSRLQFLYFFFVSIALLISYRGVLRLYYRLLGRARPGGRNRILILGAGELGKRVGKVLLDHSRWGFHPVGYLDDNPSLVGDELLGLPILATITDLAATVGERRIDEVWIALPARALDRVGEILTQLERHPVRIKLVPDYFSFAFIQTKPEVLGNLPVIGLRDPLIEGFPRILKRAFDLVIASILLIVSLPVMAAVALLIRLDSKGPIVIRQQRVGENGRLFDMLKFRSMVEGAQSQRDEVAKEISSGALIHKQPNDPRVTRVGGFLRRYSLDELPQLINVLKDDMSLVGPRPEMPWLVDRYEPWQRKRFAVPQGITGWWQINGRSDKPMHLHTEDDLYYVYNYSLWLDILILLRTPWAVIRGKGAF